MKFPTFEEIDKSFSSILVSLAKNRDNYASFTTDTLK
jgi:hypothetical protein|nr:MAG TPA: hypothetical protein [Bacteriophage sp.]